MTAASLFRRLSSLGVAATLALSPLPALASAYSVGMIAPAPAADAAPATDGKTVAVMRFGGAEAGADLRSSVVLQMQERGYTVKSVALELPAAAEMVKCADPPSDDTCLTTIGKWLNASPKTASDFIVYGGVASDPPPPVATVAIFDTAKNETIKRFEISQIDGDLIGPLVIPGAIVTAVDHHREPPAPATEAEKAELALLDEPDKTPEEIEAEKKAIADAEAAAAAAQQDAVIDTSKIKADLKEDFEAFCRTGKRKKRETKEEPKDLRPKCQRGPFWGYWQPRAWVALGLTAGTLAAAGVTYGLALGARGPYKDAVDALDAYNASVDGDPRRDPEAIVNDGQSYDALATEVSQTGAVMRRRAIVGDVLLGTSVLFAGVLTIIIFQDRSDAKKFIKEEKGIRAISDVKVGPMIGNTNGLGASFRF